MIKLLILILALMVSSCGMQGDLYLADKSAEEKAAERATEKTTEKTIEKTSQ